jgi:hypothetical protein
MYFFGNTSVLSVLNNEALASFSRKYQVSITLFWGWCGLPIPRPNKLLYVRGKPLGMPLIAEPTQVHTQRKVLEMSAFNVYLPLWMSVT